MDMESTEKLIDEVDSKLEEADEAMGMTRLEKYNFDNFTANEERDYSEDLRDNFDGGVSAEENDVDGLERFEESGKDVADGSVEKFVEENMEFNDSKRNLVSDIFGDDERSNDDSLEKKDNFVNEEEIAEEIDQVDDEEETSFGNFLGEETDEEAENVDAEKNSMANFVNEEVAEESEEIDRVVDKEEESLDNFLGEETDENDFEEAKEEKSFASPVGDSVSDIQREMAVKIAKNMLKDKFNINLISRYTMLSIDEIEKLK